MKIGSIFREENYQRFKKLEGNRTVLPLRKKRILASIREVGYVLNPIIVNERMEIIDGQGRFEVLKDLKMPIDYIVADGAGINECIAMNINQSNWQLIDYIQCYADMGMVSYKYLLALIRAYKKIGIMPICNAISQQRISPSHEGGMDGNATIKVGRFSCTESEYLEADKILSYLESVQNSILNISGGRKDMYYLAIEFAYRDPSVDNERMRSKIDSATDLRPCVNIRGALEELERIYNYNIRKQLKIYLANDYQRMLDNKE